MCCFILYTRNRKILCQVPRLSPIASHPTSQNPRFLPSVQPVTNPSIALLLIKFLNCLRPDDVVVQEGTPLSVRVKLYLPYISGSKVQSHHGDKMDSLIIGITWYGS